MTSATVIDASDATFQRDVIDRSMDVPVVVDLWATWCEPCQTLGPMIERIAQEHAGQVQLVKVDVDQNPQIASALQVQSIPAVFAFHGGRPVDQFVGALPEPEVRAFFDRLRPGQAEGLYEAGEQALASGDPAAAERHFRAALAEDPDHIGATVGLVEILFRAGSLDEAEQVAQRLSHHPQVGAQLGRIHAARLAGSIDRAALDERLAVNENDVEAHYQLGELDAAEERWPEALEHFLAVVMLDREHENDAGRRRALDIIELLGADHETAIEYRQRLTNLLF